jgi:hypothetical protein
MITYLDPSNPGDNIHWRSFSKYCSGKFGYKENLCYDISELLSTFDKVLGEFNGKIIYPNKNPESEWVMDHLEFETEEDLLFFKLKFN